MMFAAWILARISSLWCRLIRAAIQSLGDELSIGSPFDPLAPTNQGLIRSGLALFVVTHDRLNERFERMFHGYAHSMQQQDHVFIVILLDLQLLAE